MMTEHTPYQDQFFRDIQAGGFKKRSLLDRINPFTPFSSKKFVPTAKGKEFLDKFKKDTGRNLVVLPMSQKDVDKANKAFGFTPSGLYKSYKGIGGSRDPFNRYVFLSEKDPSLYPIFYDLFFLPLLIFLNNHLNPFLMPKMFHRFSVTFHFLNHLSNTHLQLLLI